MTAEVLVTVVVMVVAATEAVVDMAAEDTVTVVVMVVAHRGGGGYHDRGQRPCSETLMDPRDRSMQNDAKCVTNVYAEAHLMAKRNKGEDDDKKYEERNTKEKRQPS